MLFELRNHRCTLTWHVNKVCSQNTCTKPPVNFRLKAPVRYAKVLLCNVLGVSYINTDKLMKLE